jgi:pimeloyl-ACP methyl ester carboxylesterase
MPERLTTFTRDGLVFDVVDAGDSEAPVVVLLHGFPANPRSWAQVVPRLVGAGHRVLVPAQRGYSPGARPPGRRAYQVTELVADVLALADAAGVDRFDLAGHDWGAPVAWALAAEHPDRVRTLTAVSVPHTKAFLDAARHGQALRSWYMGFFQIPWVPEQLILGRGGANGRRMLEAAGLPPTLAADYIAYLSGPGALTAALGWYRALPTQLGSAGQPARVAVPTMMVWGDGDRFLGRWGVERTAHYVDGRYRLEVLHGVSHWVPETAPDVLADLMIDHLGEAPPLD